MSIRWSTAAVNRLKNVSHRNIARSIKVLGEGHRGWVRSRLPQLEKEDVDRFVDALRDEGVQVVSSEERVDDLKPTQKHMDSEKVTKMALDATSGKFPKIRDPILVSRDGHILDGHHRWAALRTLSPGNTLYTLRVDLPIEQLISLARIYATKEA